MDNASSAAAVRPTALSAGTLALVTFAFALYQMTSLVLGPQASRQLDLAVAVPTIDIQEAGAPAGGDTDAVIGELGAILHSAPGQASTIRNLSLVRTSTPVVTPRAVVEPVVAPRAVVEPPAEVTAAISTPDAIRTGHRPHQEKGRGRGHRRKSKPN